MGTASFPFSNNLARIISPAKITDEPVLLVKDQGLYLMAKGLRGHDGNAICAYALGCDPKDTSGDDGIGWYDRAREIAGGDDFVEEIACFDLVALTRDEGGLSFEISATHLSVMALA